MTELEKSNQIRKALLEDELKREANTICSPHCCLSLNKETFKLNQSVYSKNKYLLSFFFGTALEQPHWTAKHSINEFENLHLCKFASYKKKCLKLHYSGKPLCCCYPSTDKLFWMWAQASYFWRLSLISLVWLNRVIREIKTQRQLQNRDVKNKIGSSIRS